MSIGLTFSPVEQIGAKPGAPHHEMLEYAKNVTGAKSTMSNSHEMRGFAHRKAARNVEAAGIDATLWRAQTKPAPEGAGKSSWINELTNWR